jgi:hypothetical protein
MYSKKQIDLWSNKDLLIYFANNYKELSGNSFPIPKEAWVGMLSRMKGFKIKMELSNEGYRNFIDNVFHKFFTQDGYIPSFGAIVSEKVFFITKKLIKNVSYSNNEFETLRNQLYNSDLFKKII